jgi:hypothetical protein
VHDYKAYANQDIFMAIARFPLLKKDFVMVDAFGGVGGAQTTFKLETASQSGELTKGLFSTLISAYGVSAAVGYKKYFFFVEGGFINDKVDGLKRSGTVSDNIQTLDLSGPYAMIGFIFTDAAGFSGKK